MWTFTGCFLTYTEVQQILTFKFKHNIVLVKFDYLFHFFFSKKKVHYIIIVSRSVYTIKNRHFITSLPTLNELHCCTKFKY